MLKEGEVQGSDVAAHSAGVLDIKTNILANTDALYLTAIDKYGHELWRWTFPVDKLNQQTEPISLLSIRPTYTETENDSYSEGEQAYVHLLKERRTIKRSICR